MTPAAVTDMADIVKAFVLASGPGGDMTPLGYKLYDYVVKHFEPKAAPVVVEAAPEPVAKPVAVESKSVG
jgi:hypothetical protein